MKVTITFTRCNTSAISYCPAYSKAYSLVITVPQKITPKKKFTKNLELALKKRERIFFVTSRKRCISHNIYMLVRIQNLLLPIASRQAIDKYSTCLNVFTCDSVTDESNTCMSVRIHEQKWKSELQLLMSVKREFLSAQERNSTLWRNGYFTTK